MVLLTRFLPALMLSISIPAGAIAAAAPAAADSPTHGKTAAKPVNQQARINVRPALARVIAGYGSGGNVAPHAAAPCSTKQVSHLRTRRALHANGWKPVGTRWGCGMGGANIVIDDSVNSISQGYPATVAFTSPGTIVEATAGTEDTANAGDPPPPGDEPAPWGPGSPDWDHRILVS